MARMPKTILYVGMPKGAELRGAQKGDATWDLGCGNGEYAVEMAKDIAEALRAKGYKCKVYVNREVEQEY